MLQVTNVSLQYGSKKLFEDVNIKFTKGNCYGIIGANGAGKSTFLKVLSGEIEPNKGEVSLDKNERMSVLMQNQNAFDTQTVVRTVMLGHKRLVEIMDEKDALYSKADFSEEDGLRASELESEFAELNGWEAESEAEMLLNELDIPNEDHYVLMGELDAEKESKSTFGASAVRKSRPSFVGRADKQFGYQDGALAGKLFDGVRKHHHHRFAQPPFSQ